MDVISIIRFIATFLITNSHFGGLYPEGYSFLATGGMIGNALFFFSSGYALYKSDRSNFIKWYLKRFFRIIISVWLFMLISSLFLNGSFAIVNIVYPPYWFLQALLLFYIAYFFILKYAVNHICKIAFLFIIPLVISFLMQHNREGQFIMEETSNKYFLHYFYLFPIMLFGGLIARNKIKNTNNIGIITIMMFIAIGLYYAFKGLLITKGLYYLQLFLPLLLCLSIFTIYLTAERISRYTLPIKISKLIFYISKLTLDIYIVQFVIIRYFDIYLFPIGFFSSILVIFISAITLNFVSGFLFKKCKLILNL